jgi:peptidoglycan/xylan/chitin deacetylase (PgdA/CDA1 family)
MNRREWLAAAASLSVGCFAANGIRRLFADESSQAKASKSGRSLRDKAQIAITLDLEMSRNFPRREDTHWDYEKGNLDDAAKTYSLEAARRVKQHGGRIHFFCVGRVLEQPDVSWLQQLAAEGHPIGNHTYDHVYLLASTPEELQFRFQRAPWLIEGRSVAEVIEENIRLTTLALQQRAGISVDGFRTPGGFANGLHQRKDIQALLLGQDFRWVSSLYPPHANTQPTEEPGEAVLNSIVEAQAAAQPFVYPTGLVEIPMSPISDIGAFRTGQWKLEWFLEAVRRAVAWAIDNRAVFDFLAHPSCLGVVDPEFRTVELICQMVKDAGEKAELADLDQIAANVSR